MDLYEEFVKRLQAVSDLMPMMSGSDQALAVQTLTDFCSQVLTNYGSPLAKFQDDQPGDSLVLGSTTVETAALDDFSEDVLQYETHETDGPITETSMLYQTSSQLVDTVQSVAGQSGTIPIEGESSVICQLETTEPGTKSAQIRVLFKNGQETDTTLDAAVQPGQISTEVFLNDANMLTVSDAIVDGVTDPSVVVGLEQQSGNDSVFDALDMKSAEVPYDVVNDILSKKAFSETCVSSTTPEKELVTSEICTSTKTVRFAKESLANSPRKLSQGSKVVLLTIPKGISQSHLKRRSTCPTTDSLSKKQPAKSIKMQKHINSLKGKTKFIPEELCKCHICGKVLNNPSNLSVHMRTHSGLRPFNCRFCSKDFSSRANLLRHEVTHTGQKMFECSTCKKKFTQKSGLTSHMRSHTTEKPHVHPHSEETDSKEVKSPHATQFPSGKKSEWVLQLIPKGVDTLKCPLCSQERCMGREEMIKHLHIFHIKHAFNVQGMTIVKCRLECSTESSRFYGHYHCTCGCVLTRKQHMMYHLRNSKCHKFDDTPPEPYTLSDFTSLDECDTDPEDEADEEDEHNVATTGQVMSDQKPIQTIPQSEKSTSEDSVSVKSGVQKAKVPKDPHITHFPTDNQEEWINRILPDKTSEQMCPLCSADKYQPNTRAVLVRHLQVAHLKHFMNVQGTSIAKCHLPCSTPSSRPYGHYHCTCGSLLTRKQHMVHHLLNSRSHQSESDRLKQAEQKLRVNSVLDSDAADHAYFELQMDSRKSQKSHTANSKIYREQRESNKNTGEHIQHISVNEENQCSHAERNVLDTSENEPQADTADCDSHKVQMDSNNSQQSHSVKSDKDGEQTEVDNSNDEHITHVPLDKVNEWITRLIPDGSGPQRCPLCAGGKFKPAIKKRLIQHLKLSHLKHAVETKDVSIVKCHLLCSTRPSQQHGHYHCICGHILTRKQHMLCHLHNSKHHQSDIPVQGQQNNYSHADANKIVSTRVNDEAVENSHSSTEVHPRTGSGGYRKRKCKISKSKFGRKAVCACSVCGRIMLKQNVERHMQDMHIKKASQQPQAPKYDPKEISACSICHKTMLKRNIQRHIEIAHINPKIVYREIPTPNIGPKAVAACSICDHLILRRNLERHMKAVHQTCPPVSDQQGQVVSKQSDI